MKVVQLLYSYLLTRNDFRLQPQPERQTRDTRFGYETYLSLLLLLLRVSGYDPSRLPLESKGKNPLNLKLAKALAADSDLRELIARGHSNLANYDDAVMPLYNAITTATVFKDFSHRRTADIADEAAMWNVVLDTIIAKNEAVIAAARRDENFTTAGFAMGVKMLRDTLNACSDTRSALDRARNSLDEALEKSYELYHLLLLLPVEITKLQEQRLESAKDKYIPTSEDLNPNTRFIDNAFVKAVCESEDMEKYLKSTPINLDAHYLLVKKMLDDILASDLYSAYMDAPDTDRARDCEFWRAAMKTIILPGDALAEMLETTSVYWNDDLDIMGTFALKTIKQTASNDGPARLLPMYKDDDDARFGAQLFVDAIDNRETYRGYIDRFIDATQWDADRLAFMDIVVLTVAISELLNFPSIPVPVTINEYIEIANSYSTPRSGQFINGMLYSIVNYLKDEGKLLKD